MWDRAVCLEVRSAVSSLPYVNAASRKISLIRREWCRLMFASVTLFVRRCILHAYLMTSFYLVRVFSAHLCEARRRGSAIVRQWGTESDKWGVFFAAYIMCCYVIYRVVVYHICIMLCSAIPWALYKFRRPPWRSNSRLDWRGRSWVRVPLQALSEFCKF